MIYFILKVGALTVRMRNGTINPWDGELTFIGKVIGQLPIDVHLGKLLVLSYVFGCLEECLVISKYLFQNFKPYFFLYSDGSLQHIYITFAVFEFYLRCCSISAVFFCQSLQKRIWSLQVLFVRVLDKENKYKINY